MSVLLFIFIICTPIVLTQDSAKEDYCFVQSPFDASIFNFSTVQEDRYDVHIRINDESHLRVHFCRPLKDPCDGKQDYALCLHDKDKEIGVGREPPKILFEYEKIMFQYTGDKCNETHNYTIDIEMKCNFGIDKLPYELDVVYHREKCNFQMAVEISAACAKRRQSTCDLTNDSGYFDLSPLIDLTNNYMINLSKSVYVILNVCHSLIYGRHFKQCDHDSMVCLVDETDIEKPRYTRLGNINNDLRLSASNESLYMELTSDTPCGRDDAGGTKTIKTTIVFICKEDATNKLPEYITGFGTCHYKFRWLTIAACNEDILIKHSKVNQQPCKISDPVYDKLFDLSVLEGNITYVNLRNNKVEYQFSVCSPLQKSNCTKEGTGVCKYIKDRKIAVSKGVANTNLIWKKNQILLNYTGGSACGQFRRSYTTIIFQCNERNFFKIDDTDPCATIIDWWSPAICNHRCATPDNKINLRGLGWQGGNYRIQDQSNMTEFHLNVCEPLVDEGYTTCTFGTGICQVTLNDEGKRIKELNLGYPQSGLYEADDGSVYMKFDNGSVCEEDSSKNITSKITFTCDEDVHAVGYLFFTKAHDFLNHMTFLRYVTLLRGLQAFESYSNCQYNFKWRTSYACPDRRSPTVEKCIRENKIHVFNLPYLINHSLFTENKGQSTGYFNESFCDKCNGTFVCDNKPYYRKDKAPTTLPRTEKLVAFEIEDSSSYTEFYKSFLKKWCRLWASVGDSFLLKVDRSEENATNNENVPPLTVFLVILGVVVIIGKIFLIVYCYRNRQSLIMCLDCIANVIHANPGRRDPVPAEELVSESRF